MKKIVTAGIVVVTLVACFIFSEKILRGFGNFLINEDELQHAEAIFVLGGDSYDRGNEAVKLFKDGYSQKIVCMGENIPTIFQAMGISHAESEVTKMNILKQQLSDSVVFVLKKGTSTKEEADAIVDYCNTYNLKKVILISSKFHTRRVKMVCGKLFEENNIELIVAGAPSSVYSEEEWWKTEEGLIMVNNEYVKLFYYLIKY